MVITDIHPFQMASGWTAQKRHCMHILATHYPDSSWPDRAAIFNLVCNDHRTANQARDEYGGHKSGRLVPGIKQTRSKMWNDEVCRDEFGLPGPFNAQQQIDRGTILQNIQAAINTLGLGGNAGLGAVSLVPGMQLANVALANSNTAGITPTGLAATAPPLIGPAPASAPAQAGTSSSAATAPAANTAATATATTANDEGDDDESDDDGLVDPANGGAAWYHSWEIQREDPGGRFVYREIPNLPYDDDSPSDFPRRVHFPALGMQSVEVQVCAVRTCSRVCGLERFHSDSSEEDDGGEEDGGEEDGGEKDDGEEGNDLDA